MLSYAWSLSRSYGSQPPTRTLPPTSRLGKRGARSRRAGGSRFSQRSGGSVMCESAEIRCSRPIVTSTASATGTSLTLGNGMASPSRSSPYGLAQPGPARPAASLVLGRAVGVKAAGAPASRDARTWHPEVNWGRPWAECAEWREPMLSREENERLTRVGPGTPMGTLLRRYWFPIAATADLDANPVKGIKLLGEDLVLFRDRGGRLGLIGEGRPHRPGAE